MNIVQYEKNSYGSCFQKLPDGSFLFESQENNPQLNAWKLANGEPILNTSLDLMGPIPIGSIPPIISE
jgi:hypothetical protein